MLELYNTFKSKCVSKLSWNFLPLNRAYKPVYRDISLNITHEVYRAIICQKPSLVMMRRVPKTASSMK